MLMIGTPCYSGMVTVNYMRSLIQMIGFLEQKGVKTGLLTPCQESLITRARNLIANEFLRQKSYSHLLFIDADIGFPPELPWKYLEADKDVVCGIYPVKHLDVDKLRSIDSKALGRVAEAASMHYAVKLKPGGRPDRSPACFRSSTAPPASCSSSGKCSNAWPKPIRSSSSTTPIPTTSTRATWPFSTPTSTRKPRISARGLCVLPALDQHRRRDPCRHPQRVHPRGGPRLHGQFHGLSDLPRPTRQRQGLNSPFGWSRRG